MAKKLKTSIRPKRLAPGDTIGIVAPASPFDKKEYQKGLAALASMGFKTFSPDDVFRQKVYLAGSDEHRAEAVNRMFADSSIKAVVCARGGFGSLRMIPFLNFNAIRKNPKIFWGYSDASAILSVLYTQCNLVAFHGPMVTSLGASTFKTKKALLAAFSSDKRVEIKPERAVEIKPGTASGPVLGGNLTTLCHMVGTPFEPRTNGHILFLEDKGEKAYRIDRMLTQMRLAGYFDQLAGLILGSFEQCGAIDDIYRIVEDIFKNESFPILAGFNIGHGRENLTIPIGIEATLDMKNCVLSFHEASTVL